MRESNGRLHNRVRVAAHKAKMKLAVHKDYCYKCRGTRQRVVVPGVGPKCAVCYLGVR